MRFIAYLLVLFALFFSACSDKNKEYNKPAIYWYKKMIEAINSSDLEEADDFFVSLQSEHLNSPLLPEAMLILARAHIDEKEYLLANFYLDEYIKRFGTRNNIEFAKTLKIKAHFLSFKLTGRDQQLLLDSIKEAERFIREHPYSEHRPIVDTMLAKMLLANLQFNKEIASLYKTLDKPKAAEIYENRVDYEWVKSLRASTPDESWYRQAFDW